MRLGVFTGLLVVVWSGAVAVDCARASQPWATSVVSFNAGSGGQSGYDLPESALGSPTRISGVGTGWDAPVTPFAAPYLPEEVVSIGQGGWLTVQFDHPVVNDPANPYGIDLLVFGNSFFVDPTYTGTAAGIAAEGGVIEVSADGVTWKTVTGVGADGLFPMLAYSDLTDPYATTPGEIESDFTRPVDPSFNPIGKGFSEIVAGYAGSGGGAGVDIGVLGLSEISFVRVSNPAGSGTSPEIDAFADVAPIPGPTTPIFGGLSAACVIGRRRRPGARS